MKIIATVFLIATFSFAAFENIQTFKADFTQRVIDVSGKEISYEGKMYAKAPFLVLWKYLKPIEKEIYIQRENMTVYESELEQATITMLKDSLDFMQVLKSAQKVKEDEYHTHYGDTEYIVMIQNDLPHTITFKDKLENTVQIEFSKVKTNFEVSEDFFYFIPPENTDIIRQ